MMITIAIMTTIAMRMIMTTTTTKITANSNHGKSDLSKY